VGTELRDVPTVATEEAELGGRRDDGVALAGNGFDECGFTAAVGTEDGHVFAVGDAQRNIVQNDVVATGDGDIAHEEKVGRIGWKRPGHREIIAELRMRSKSAGSGSGRMTTMAEVHLNLWKKHLGSVPDEVWAQTDLETLVLADNDLTELSEKVGQLRKLRMLDLGHNRLERLPDAMGDLKELTSFLYLHDNRLTGLPSSMARLRQLRYLNISENLLTLLPEPVCDMSGLQELRATDNQIGELPEEIGRLSRLRELHLRNNRLTALPDAVGRLDELRQIDLRGNPLQSLPETMAGLPKLEKIDLRWVTTLRAPAWLEWLEDRGCLVYW